MAAAFSTISSRRRSGFLEGTHAVPVYFLLKARLLGWFGNQVHRPAQSCFKAFPQLIEAANVIKAARGRGRIERHGYVDIRLLRRVAARRRAEQREAHNAKRSQLGFAAAQGCDDCVS